MLVTLQNVFYCEYNLESEDGPISETEKKSFQIISNYLRTYNLNFILVENNTFNIVITDLRTISSEECELKVCNNHSI